MEKVIIILRGTPGDELWCTRLRTDIAQKLLDTGAPGVAINVRDALVTDSLMTLTSTSAFGANRDVDTVPTSRYVLRAPFAPTATLQP